MAPKSDFVEIVLGAPLRLAGLGRVPAGLGDLVFLEIPVSLAKLFLGLRQGLLGLSALFSDLLSAMPRGLGVSPEKQACLGRSNAGDTALTRHLLLQAARPRFKRGDPLEQGRHRAALLVNLPSMQPDKVVQFLGQGSSLPATISPHDPEGASAA